VAVPSHSFDRSPLYRCQSCAQDSRKESLASSLKAFADLPTSLGTPLANGIQAAFQAKTHLETIVGQGSGVAFQLGVGFPSEKAHNAARNKLARAFLEALPLPTAKPTPRKFTIAAMGSGVTAGQEIYFNQVAVSSASPPVGAAAA